MAPGPATAFDWALQPEGVWRGLIMALRTLKGNDSD